MTEAIFFESWKEFSQWLEEHHSEASEVWVGYFRKGTGRAGLSWSASVDAALCFGWIDGIRKRMDKQRYMIRFTPRKENSIWSAVNVKKVKELIKNGEMRPEGMKAFLNVPNL